MNARMILVFIALFVCDAGFGQKDDPCYIYLKNKGLRLINEAKYPAGLNAYLAALSCNNGNRTELAGFIREALIKWNMDLVRSRDSALYAQQQARIQRDSAIGARKAAELESKRSKAVSYAFLAEQVGEKDPAKGLQLAAAGYEITSAPLPRLKLALSNIIERQMSERDRAGTIVNFGQLVPSRVFPLKQGFYKIHFSGEHVFLFDAIHGYSIVKKDSLKELIDLEAYGSAQLTLSHDLESFSTLWREVPYVSSLKTNRYIQLQMPDTLVSGNIIFSNDDKRFAAGLRDGKWIVWDSSGTIIARKRVVDSLEHVNYPGVNPDRFIRNGKALWGHQVFMPGKLPDLTHYHRVKIFNIESGTVENHAFFNRSAELNFSSDNSSFLLVDSIYQLAIMSTDWRVIHKIAIPNEKIRDAAYSSDDNYIFIYCESEQVYVYSSKGEQIGHFQRPEYGMITSYSPKNKRIIVSNGQGMNAGADHRKAISCLYDLKGNQLKVLTTPAALESVQFSADETKILGWTQFGSVIVWNSNGDPIRRINPVLFGLDKIQDAKFTPDSKEIICVSGTGVSWFDLNGLLTQEIAFPGKSIECIAEFNSTDDKVILNTDFLIDRKSLEVNNLSGKFEIRYILDGRKYLISGGNQDKGACICRVDTNACWCSDKMEKYMLRIAQNKREFLTWYSTKSYDSYYAAIWDFDKGLLDTIAVGSYGGASYSGGDGLFVQHDSAILFYNRGGEVLLYSRADKSIRKFKVNQVASIDYCPKTGEVGTVSMDAMLRFFTLSGQPLDSFHLPMTAMVFFDPSGNSDQILLYTRYDLFFLNRRTGQLVTAERKFTINANFDNLTFSPKGDVLFTTNSDIGTISVRDFSGKQLYGFSAHQPESFPFAASFSPDGRYILSYASDGTAKLWDIGSGAKGNLLAGVYQHTGGVNSAVFSSDGRYLMTAGNDSSIRIYPLPETIYEWVKNANYPPLTREELIGLGLEEQ